MYKNCKCTFGVEFIFYIYKHELTETRVLTWWAIFGDHIGLRNFNTSFLRKNNDILILLQTSTFAIYLTIET